MDEIQSVEANKTGVVSQRGLYAKLAGNSELFLARLLEMVNSRNENVAVAGLKIAWDRLLPALKGVELRTEDDRPLKIHFVYEGQLPGHNPSEELPQATTDIRQPS